MTGIGGMSLRKVRLLLVLHSSPLMHWLEIYCVAKNFIKSLLNPDPAKRPTAAAALADHVRIVLPILALQR